MNNWPVYKIENICDIKSGKRIPLGFDFVINETQHPYIRARDIKNGRINTDDLIYLDDSTFAKIKKYIIEENDIAITIVGASIGDIGFATKEVNGFNLTENAVRLTNFKDNVSSQYLFYLLVQNQYKEFMQTIAGGAAQPKLGIYKIQRIKVQLPPLPTQQKIASILSAYDNLIQNYKKQIEALQTAARELYKEWFVRFRFPGWKNAKFENGIPEGWKIERIGTLYDSTSGGTPSREHEEYFQNGTYPWIKTGELKDCPIIETEESITDEAIKHSSAKLFEKDSLIIAMYGATIGQLGINKMKATCNQACCVLRPKKDKAFGIYYLFHFFKENREFIIGLGNGAAQQNLSQVLINKLKIVNPNKEILEIFEKKESLFFEKIYHLQQQITNLTQQRDLLLPRLMSGKLEV